MAWGTVRLKPGVVTQETPVLNESGVSQSNLIRYHDGLIQKLGGWQKYYSGTFTSTIREIHGWSALLGTKYLAVGATGQLASITNGSLSDITPQTYTSNPAPNLSISSGSSLVTVIDAGSSTTLFDTVYFNTPVAIGNILLNGAYPINSVGGTSTYTIVSSVLASTTITSSGILPSFTTTANSATVTVDLPNNNFQKINGLFYNFIAPTSVGNGITVQGAYQVNSITNSTEFKIIAATQAASADTQTMNGGNLQLVYYISVGPPAVGSGWGVGGWGLGGWGMGSGASGGGTGTPITATDWSLDNWGSVLLACPTDGPIYQWSGDSGFTTASVISQAPFFNGGIFISQPQQILVAWRSCQSTGVQSPMVVRWSDAGDFTNWTVSNQTAAGSFTIPRGSRIVGGVQAGLTGVIWTDIGVWLMQYVGGDVIFNFTEVGHGCGLIGPHARGTKSGQVYWMGQNNIFILGPNGVEVVPCSVWDFVFQNLNRNFVNRVRCAINSMFDEVTFYFPSTKSTGENDSYIRLNTRENEWDYGSMQRCAWEDVTALGNPIGTTVTQIFQHEVGNDADGTAMNPSFTTGYFTIAEGEQMAFVNYLVPDMKWTTFSSTGGSAQVQITINALDFVGDSPRTYGPVTFTSTTEFLNPRLRGRFMNMTVTSADVGSFWRVGGIKYRYSPAGRR